MKIPFGTLAKKLLAWLVKAGLEEARKEAGRLRDEHVGTNGRPPEGGREP